METAACIKNLSVNIFVNSGELEIVVLQYAYFSSILVLSLTNI